MKKILILGVNGFIGHHLYMGGSDDRADPVPVADRR